MLSGPAAPPRARARSATAATRRWRRSWAPATGEALQAAGLRPQPGPARRRRHPRQPDRRSRLQRRPRGGHRDDAAAVTRLRQSGLACAAAHFPGLGGASDDTAEAPATVGLDPASLEARDLSPFRAAFAAGRRRGALARLLRRLRPGHPGGALARRGRDLLRDELDFKGVAISDDLTAGAITAGLGASGGGRPGARRGLGPGCGRGAGAGGAGAQGDPEPRALRRRLPAERARSGRRPGAAAEGKLGLLPALTRQEADASRVSDITVLRISR